MTQNNSDTLTILLIGIVIGASLTIGSMMIAVGLMGAA